VKVSISAINIGDRKRPAGDVSELAESISRLGLLHPIVINDDMTLVAGLRRLEACKLLGWTQIEATRVTLDDLRAELAEIDENLIREELTVLERGEQLARRKEIYEALHPEAKAGYRRAAGMNKALGHNVEEIVSPTFTADVAAKTGLTPRTIRHDVQIATQIAEDVRDMLRETPLADSKKDLLQLARRPANEQRQIAKRIRSGKAKNVAEAASRIKREQLAAVGAEIASKARCWNVWQADIQSWTAPRQYDFIITDPPYPKEYLHLYEVLARRAAEWLKPSGLLIAMAGQTYLDEIYAAMGKHLDYYWTAAYLTPGQPTPLAHVNVNSTWKPLLIYQVKGQKYRGKTFGDVFKSDGNEKDFHKWGQSVSGMYDIISKVCLPGQHILDPFCGGGTTGVAAIKCGCLFDGIDISEESVNITKARLGA
jgi:site-specific DNA-methyltransferase (adenine-specific)